MSDDDRLYLRTILERIERIERYTVEGKQHFLADDKTQDAALRNLHVLAESTQRLSEEAKVRRPEIEWRSIAAFRNVVVHNYLGLDAGQVWSIVEHDLPPLKHAVRQMLGEAN